MRRRDELLVPLVGGLLAVAGVLLAGRERVLVAVVGLDPGLGVAGRVELHAVPRTGTAVGMMRGLLGLRLLALDGVGERLLLVLVHGGFTPLSRLPFVLALPGRAADQ